MQFGSCEEVRRECQQVSAGVCFQCINQDYFLNGFSCLAKSKVPKTCSLYDYINGYCLVCEPGYEMQHRYCQRWDKIMDRKQDYAKSNTQNAIKMPDDVLGGSSNPVPTQSRFNSDNIITEDNDIEIRTSRGSGWSSTSNSIEGCWLTAADGTCSLCLEGYNPHQGTCVKAEPKCTQFDQAGWRCLKCVPALQLNNGSCLDPNCGVPVFGRCVQCLNNTFTVDGQGVCVLPGCKAMKEGVCG